MLSTMRQKKIAKDIIELTQNVPLDDVVELGEYISKLYGIPYGLGCSRIAYLFPDFVVKMSHVDKGKILIQEYEFIAMMRRSSYRKHFPKTTLIHHGAYYALIQERIKGVGSDRSYNHEIAVSKLGALLDIDDVNGDNFGWKGNTPVFVDVACRISHYRED
jgi:hypothetical protein